MLSFVQFLSVIRQWGRPIQRSDPYRILRNYFQFTYNRIDEENKFIDSQDGKLRCMNTGLLTVYNQEIVAIFAKNNREGKIPWFLNGFFKETDKFFTTNFSALPCFQDMSGWLCV